jgi:hypothetical protein
MQTASFTGFIRILFYILAFYYIFKFLAKLPLIVKSGESRRELSAAARKHKLPGKGNEIMIIYNDSNSKKTKRN